MYVAPHAERLVFGSSLSSVLENFSGKGDLNDYEEADGFSGDSPTP